MNQGPSLYMYYRFLGEPVGRHSNHIFLKRVMPWPAMVWYSMHNMP